jgi:hypothetical protein
MVRCSSTSRRSELSELFSGDICGGSHLWQEFAKAFNLVEADLSEEGGAAQEELDGIVLLVKRSSCKRHQPLSCNDLPRNFLINLKL